MSQPTQKSGQKRKQPTTNSSRKSKKSSDEPSKEASNASFWKKKYTLENGEESELTPYEHLWNFLAKDRGRFLHAFKRWPYEGKSLALKTSAIANEASTYLNAKGVPEKKTEAVRSAIYKIDEDCKKVCSMMTLSGEGNNEGAFKDLFVKSTLIKISTNLILFT